MSVSGLNTGLALTCFVGFALSYYAYFVETAKDEDESYEAMCDISERISCTKAFASEYGKGFGIIPKTSIFYLPNPLYGLTFYTLVAVLGVCNSYSTSVATITLGILSNVGSVYLASLLYVLNVICIVCVSTYVVNAIILILAIKKHRNLFRRDARKKKKKN